MAAAANLPGFLHNRRFAAKHRPGRRDNRSLTCAFMLGSSSPLRGVATARRVRRARQGTRSSSPLRGVATGCRRGATTSRPRPHRPYEGSQRAVRSHGPAGSPRPHRPYEGSQHGGGVHLALGVLVLIAPTRGRNKVSALGQIRNSTVLIAPTRGRNTSGQAAGSPSNPPSSSPLREVATRRRPGSDRQAAGPHRPYEGSQQSHLAHAAPREDVLIAPTRGRNA